MKSRSKSIGEIMSSDWDTPDVLLMSTNFKFEYNFEEKTLQELKKIRKNIRLNAIRDEDLVVGYMIKMIDILLEKVERLENDNQ